MKGFKSRVLLFFTLMAFLAVGGLARAVSPEDNPYLPETRKTVRKVLDRLKKNSAFPEAEKQAREAAAVAEKRAAEMKTLKFSTAEKLKISEPENSTSAREKPETKERYYLVISSSIPVDTLRTYTAQISALASSGTIVIPVLRGFVQGMKRIRPTLDFYLRIALKNPSAGLSRENLRPISLYINPLVTKGIKAVPALETEDGSCAVYGDAPLKVLLEKLREGECGKTFGAVYRFAERNALDEIKEAVQERFPSAHEIEAYFRNRLVAFLEHLPGENLLPPARRTVKRTLSLFYTLPFTLQDPKTGETLYPEGYQFNPLEYAPPVPFKVLLINGTREAEVKFARKLARKDYTLLIASLGGNAKKLEKNIRAPVYSGIAIARTGWCSATPCLVKRKKNSLEITEFGPENLNKPEGEKS